MRGIAIWVLALSLFLGGLPRSHADSLPGGAEALYDAALRAEAAGQWDEAVHRLAELLSRHPDHDRGRLLQGAMLVRVGDYLEAALILAPLLEKPRSGWRPWFWMGTAELLMGRLENAADYLDEALAIEGGNAAIWIQRALVEQQRGQDRFALQMLAVAEQLAPDDPRVALNIAYSLDRLGRAEEAVARYTHYLLLTAGREEERQARRQVLQRIGHLSLRSE